MNVPGTTGFFCGVGDMLILSSTSSPPSPHPLLTRFCYFSNSFLLILFLFPADLLSTLLWLLFCEWVAYGSIPEPRHLISAANTLALKRLYFLPQQLLTVNPQGKVGPYESSPFSDRIILYRAYKGIHTCCEFKRAPAMSCPEVSSPQSLTAFLWCFWAVRRVTQTFCLWFSCHFSLVLCILTSLCKS